MYTTAYQLHDLYLYLVSIIKYFLNLKTKLKLRHTGNGIRGKLRDCSLVFVCAVRSISNLFGPRCLICLSKNKI
jgi:hypothetical protein